MQACVAYAACHGPRECLQLLLEARADLNTPLTVTFTDREEAQRPPAEAKTTGAVTVPFDELEPLAAAAEGKTPGAAGAAALGTAAVVLPSQFCTVPTLPFTATYYRVARG